MSVSRVGRPLVTAVSRISRPHCGIAIGPLQDALSHLRIGGSAPAAEGRRYASVKAQGAYKLRDSRTIPKKMGAKKTGDSHVIPGNIIYKQRGTIWFPGENCGMGRDHTIHALVEGYVKYYKDPKKHPKRQYIGVVFNKTDKLPYDRHAMRKRRLNMTASPIVAPRPEPEMSASGIPNVVIRPEVNKKPQDRYARRFRMRPELGYAYKEDLWHLAKSIRTSKRKLGSRRQVMRRRRTYRKAILAEMRAQFLDRQVQRKEDSVARRNAKKAAALASAERARVAKAKGRKSPEVEA